MSPANYVRWRPHSGLRMYDTDIVARRSRTVAAIIAQLMFILNLLRWASCRRGASFYFAVVPHVMSGNDVDRPRAV